MATTNARRGVVELALVICPIILSGCGGSNGPTPSPPLAPTPPPTTPAGLPVLPLQFSVHTNETFVTNGGKPDKCAGRWTYDWPNRRAVFEHGRSSLSEFCRGNDPLDQSCRLLFLPHEPLWVQYANGTCCSVCEAKIGCSMLLPDYLRRAGGEKKDVFEIEGARCQGWGAPGSVTKTDSFYFDEDDYSRLCQYFELLSFNNGTMNIAHNITFLRDSWTTELSDADFELPSQCTGVCPKTFPPHEQLLHV